MARKKDYFPSTRKDQHGETCMCRRCRGREEAILRDKQRFVDLKEVARSYEEDNR